jgi:hypothetical protein
MGKRRAMPKSKKAAAGGDGAIAAQRSSYIQRARARSGQVHSVDEHRAYRISKGSLHKCGAMTTKKKPCSIALAKTTHCKYHAKNGYRHGKEVAF